MIILIRTKLLRSLRFWTLSETKVEKKTEMLFFYFRTDKNKKKMTKKSTPVLRSSICTLKRQPGSRWTKKRDATAIATASELRVAKAIKELRAELPLWKHFGSVLIRTRSGLSEMTVKRLLKTRTFTGQHKQVPHYVLLHQAHMAKIKKTVSSGVFIHLSQGETTRTSRKTSCC